MIRLSIVLGAALMSSPVFAAQTAPREQFPENATEKAPGATPEKGVVSGTLVEICAQWNLSKADAASCRKELEAAKDDKERLAVRTRYETRQSGNAKTTQ